MLVKADPLNPSKLSRPRIPALALSVDDAAKALSLCSASVEMLVRTGELHHVRVGRRVLIPTKQIVAWLDRATVSGGGK
jgi:excisionase family DNA binding protein